MRTVFLALLIAASSWAAQSTTYVLKAARLFDGTSDRLIEPGVIVVSGNKIASIGGQIPSGATVIDLGDATLLPGFIDVGLRNAINSGVVPGPRMLVSVHAIGATGGHCDDGDGFKFGLLNHESGPEDGVVNSPD
ncbi:MAG: hypothetical protein M3Y07_18030 [Acidobacteriota bacterium]|nr:hypothetical protein [Acidobacteriota bacterium]